MLDRGYVIFPVFTGRVTAVAGRVYVNFELFGIQSLGRGGISEAASMKSAKPKLWYGRYSLGL
jgi:hypothetical protein